MHMWHLLYICYADALVYLNNDSAFWGLFDYPFVLLQALTHKYFATFSFTFLFFLDSFDYAIVPCTYYCCTTCQCWYSWCVPNLSPRKSYSCRCHPVILGTALILVGGILLVSLSRFVSAWETLTICFQVFIFCTGKFCRFVLKTCACMGKLWQFFSRYPINPPYGEVLSVCFKTLCPHGETLTIFFQVSCQSFV